MPNTHAALMANGNIYPFRFLKMDTTASTNFKVLQATANSKIRGISQVGTNYPPIVDPAITVSGYAATAGQPVQIHGPGDVCLVEAGAPIAVDDYLKSDNDGKAVPIATAGTTLQRYGARALEAAAAAGEKIHVQVEFGSERPAVA
jgi:hypothetical protein